jgi:hypothetical protein
MIQFRKFDVLGIEVKVWDLNTQKHGSYEFTHVFI